MASSKSNGLEASDWARGPTTTGPAWQRFLKAIYNPEEKSFLGRTAKRWGIVLVFYSVFYIGLALLFGLCMGGLFLTIDQKKPSYTLSHSLIGANPGVSYRPIPLGYSTVLAYNRENNYTLYADQLQEFLEPYGVEKTRTVCTHNDSYGYPDGPCFFIKLNKIYSWEPECYNAKESLPAEMPENLKEYIQAIDQPLKYNQIWISCEEEKGNSTVLEYPWGQGLHSQNYPFLNQEGYLSPIVAVKVVLPPEVTSMIVIRCRAWAKNIVYNKSLKDPSGYTRIIISV